MKLLLVLSARWIKLLLVIYLTVEISASAQILPASRTLAGSGGWGTNLVGVPGGIPYRTNIYTTIPAGSSVSTVQTAINNCPSNSVVYLSAGTYTWSSSLNMKSGVTLRGAGPGLTIINSSVNNSIVMQGYYSSTLFNSSASGQTRVNWTGGYSQGTNVVTLSSVSGLSVGQFIWFDQLNDQDTMPYGSNPGFDPGDYSTPSFPATGQDRLQFQMDMVTNIVGNTVYLSEPIYMPNWTSSLSPQAWWESGLPMRYAGIESMTINCTGGGSDTGIWGGGDYACWVENVTLNYYRYDMQLELSLRCEVRHCSINGPEVSGVTDLYGYYPRWWFGDLAIDNTANDTGTAFLLKSSSGCAFAYNYSTNGQMKANFYLGFVYYAHGGNPNMCLFEGNWGPGFGMDNTWGSASYNVAFRNRFTGNADLNPAASGNIQAIDISNTNRHMSVFGNVLGTIGYNTVYQETVTNCTGGPRVYFLGGDSGCSGVDDPIVRSTLLRGYNWTSATSTNNGIVNDGYTSSQVPPSLVYSGIPTNFGILKWPPVDPANPAYSMSRTNIPAGYRFVFGVDPPQSSGSLPPAPQGFHVVTNATVAVN